MQMARTLQKEGEKMKKLKNSIMAIALTIMCIAGIIQPMVVHAADEYYVFQRQYGALVKSLYVKNAAGGDEVVAYCFNAHKGWPGVRNYSVKKYENADENVFRKLAETPRGNFRQGVLEVCYKGFPKDATGIREKYNLPNDMFRMITQAAVWYYTDSQDMTKTSFYINRPDWWTQDVIKAYNELISTPVQLPANYTLDLYETNSSYMQNALSTKLADNYVPPKPEPQPEPTKSITVKKNWELYGHSENEIAQNVQVQLYKDDAAYGDPVTLDKGNNWSYKWDKLPETGKYSVKEVNVPAGCVSRVDAYNEATGTINVYNSMKPELVIKKEVQGEYGDKTKGFSFDLTLAEENGTPLNGEYPCVKLDKDGKELSSEKLKVENGKATFTLSDSQTIKLKDLPPKVHYTVSEINGDGKYTAKYYKGETPVAGEKAEGTITNENLDNNVKVVNICQEEYRPDTGIRLNNNSILAWMGILAGGILLFGGITILHFRRRMN